MQEFLTRHDETLLLLLVVENTCTKYLLLCLI